MIQLGLCRGIFLICGDLCGNLCFRGHVLRVLMLRQRHGDDLAKKIEEEMEYPGQIKVNLIRETKCVEYAK